MITQNTFVLNSSKHKKQILIDFTFNKAVKTKEVVIFCHGYKGFKDWGAWNLVAQNFAKNNIAFVKFNFSHNGGTIENPIDFPDLESFSKNNFEIELQDIEDVINWVKTYDAFSKNSRDLKISLIGHSRGGGIALIKASENPLIKKVITWAAVSDFENRFPKDEALKQWEDSGVFYVKNARTNQQMPHLYQYYQNFKANEHRFTIKLAVENLEIPFLIIHGENDKVVAINEAQNLEKWSGNGKLKVIKNTEHTFGISHPWQFSYLSKQMAEVVKESVQFILEND